MIWAPAAGWIFILSNSALVNGPGLERICSGTASFPTLRSNAAVRNARRSESPNPICRPISSALLHTLRPCLRCSGSRPSMATASDSITRKWSALNSSIRAALLLDALQVQLVSVHHPVQHGDHQQSDLPTVVTVGNRQQTGRAAARDVMRKGPEKGLFPRARGEHGQCRAAYGKVNDRRQNHQQGRRRAGRNVIGRAGGRSRQHCDRTVKCGLLPGGTRLGPCRALHQRAQTGNRDGQRPTQHRHREQHDEKAHRETGGQPAQPDLQESSQNG